MSERQVLQLVTSHRPWYRRAMDAVRSVVLGPFNSKDPALVRLFGRGATSAGVSVDEYTALNLSAVWSAISIIAGDVASLPLSLYRRRPDGGKEQYVGHPLFDLLHSQPNPEMSSIAFREAVQGHALSWGNGYAEIERDDAARPVALWPLTPDRVAPYRSPSGALVYRVTNEQSGHVVIPAADMLHIHGLGFDGVCGYSVITKARESFGLTAATERFGAQFFGNGSNASGIFKHPGKLSEPAFKHLRDSLKEHHAGDANRSPIILEEGMDWTQIGVPPDDGQFLGTRLFQIAEIARWFNMPPHKLRDLSRATFSNIEAQGIEYVTGTLTPWLVRWEQELDRKLIRPLERRQQFTKHNVNALLRGDIASRYAAYATGRQWGWLSANDVLAKEDENPIGPQGDIYLAPQNMAPADKIDQIIDAQTRPPTPTPPAEPDPGDDADAAVDRAFRDETRAMLVALAIRLDEVRDRPGATPEQVAGLAEQIAAAAESIADLGRSTAERQHETREAVAALRAAIDAVGQPSVDPAMRADTAATLHLAERASAAATTAVAQVGAVREDVGAIREMLAQPPPPPVRDLVVEERLGAFREEMLGRLDALAEVIRAAHQPPPEPEPDPAPETQETARTIPRDRARLVAAHRAAIEDAVGRLVRRETLKARRAAKSPEKLRAWIADYYPRQQAAFEAILLPAMQAHCGMVGDGRDPVAATHALVVAHVETSRAQLHALIDAAPADLAAEAEALLTRWERDRPGALADALMEEELAHVGS